MVAIPWEGSTMSVYCYRCGLLLPENARYCSNCGIAVPGVQGMPGRPLIRPLAGRQIAGVCIALAQAYSWDVAMVRILTVVGLFFSGGFVAVAYLACWIGIPAEKYPPGI
jgi:phage shock protein PspC (stress-responsive transcriptional regulator)